MRTVILAIFICFFTHQLLGQTQGEEQVNITWVDTIKVALSDKNRSPFLVTGRERIDSIRIQTRDANIIVDLFFQEAKNRLYEVRLVDILTTPNNPFFEVRPEQIYYQELESTTVKQLIIVNDDDNNNFRLLNNTLSFVFKMTYREREKRKEKFLGLIPPIPAIYCHETEVKLNLPTTILQGAIGIWGGIELYNGFQKRKDASENFKKNYLQQNPPAPSGAAYIDFLDDRREVRENVLIKDKEGRDKVLLWGGIVTADVLYLLYRLDRIRIINKEKRGKEKKGCWSLMPTYELENNSYAAPFTGLTLSYTFR